MAYRVTYGRDESGWWVASVPSVRGCHTQGRTIRQARERIREALGLFVADAKRATLRDEILLPGRVRSLVARQHAARERADAEQARAQAVTREAVRRLTRDVGLSVRDAGELLGLSHQRVQQLVHG